MFKLSLFMAFMLPSIIFGQVNEISQGELIQRIEKSMEGSLEEFIDNMKGIDNLSKQYIERKEDECSREFSSFVLDKDGNKVLKKKVLNRKEKKQCLYMVIDFRIKVTRLMFKARKKYLEKLQVAQLEELAKREKNSLNMLEQLAKKYR